MGAGSISFVDIRDVAKVATIVINHSGHEGKAYQITGSQALTNHQIAEMLSGILGRSITYVDIPEEVARQAMASSGIPDKQIEMVLGLYARQKAGRYSQVTSVIETVTGDQPITFARFVQDYQDAF